ncbi:MAG TPA: hypothetical protein VH143_08945 [Kofleriaceae bacterium]|nr:hypothetical protein [Kofleriaceae bacterium]
MKLLVGLLKGAVIGAAIGYGAAQIGFGDGAAAWLTYGVIGVLVGLLVGRPLWSLIKDTGATTWVSVLKAAFGFGVGCGLYALIAKVWAPNFQIAGYSAMWSPFVGGAIGAVYGGFVELDDAIGSPPAGDKAKPKSTVPASAKSPGKKPE